MECSAIACISARRGAVGQPPFYPKERSHPPATTAWPRLTVILAAVLQRPQWALSADTRR